MNEILKKYLDFAERLNSFTEEDMTVVVCDDNVKVISCIHGETIQVPLKEGQILGSNTVLHRTMRTGEKTSRIVPKEEYGVPLVATAAPIFDEKGMIVGGICTLKHLTDKQSLLDMIRNLTLSLNEISRTVSQISASAQEIATSGEGMIELVSDAIGKARETDQVVGFVQQIAKQTNLLGLNAAIEAARAGEAGRGFQVVAEEIRKMAMSSNESVDKIATVLKDIRGTVEQILLSVEKNGALTEEQAAGTQQITASLQELTALAERLNEFAMNL